MNVSEIKYKLAAKLSNLGFFAINLSNKEEFWDENMLLMIESSSNPQEKLFERFTNSLIHEEDRELFIESYNAVQDSEEEIAVDYKLNNGFTFKFLSTIISTQINEKNEKVVFFVTQDLTEKKTLELERMELLYSIEESNLLLANEANVLENLNYKLELSEKELIQTNAAKDKFFSIIAHDLKSPMSGLLGYLSIMQQDLLNLSVNEIIKFLENLHNAADSLYSLLENLLEWSQIQRGKIPFNPDDFNLKEVVTTIFYLAQNNADNKNITLNQSVNQEFTLYCDRNMLLTIFRNLVFNSIKFTEEGGSISISANLINEDFMQIDVTDTGVGMDELAQSKIFRIDEHHTTRGTKDESGTGLGLTICQELVEKHGGKIWVLSQEGEGTTFSFTMPRNKYFIDSQTNE